MQIRPHLPTARMAFCVIFVMGGCTPPATRAAGGQAAPVGKPASTCRYYTGSRVCREPDEVSTDLSCDAVQRGMAQGFEPGRSSLACDQSGRNPAISPSAPLPVSVHR